MPDETQYAAGGTGGKMGKKQGDGTLRRFPVFPFSPFFRKKYELHSREATHAGPEGRCLYQQLRYFFLIFPSSIPDETQYDSGGTGGKMGTKTGGRNPKAFPRFPVFPVFLEKVRVH